MHKHISHTNYFLPRCRRMTVFKLIRKFISCFPNYFEKFYYTEIFYIFFSIIIKRILPV